MSGENIINKLLDDQPDDRQLQREARIVLHSLLNEAAEEILRLKALQIAEEINRRLTSRGLWHTDMPEQLPTLKAADGFTVSVQASEYHYCVPRKNEGPYSHVECGYPSELPTAKNEWLPAPWAKWAETPNTTQTVFAYIPIIEVAREFARRGGLI